MKSELDFRKEMLEKGDVEKLLLVTNKDLVRVYIKPDSLQKPYYRSKLNKKWPGTKTTGPHFEFTVTKAEEFAKTMSAYFKEHPDQEVAIEITKEGEWFQPAVSIVLPLLIIVLIWIMLMRKMGGGAGGSGGPGGIFNIGKSRATLFDKGTKVSITFADVAGLDEAKVEVMEIVDFLKNPKKYTALGVRYRRVHYLLVLQEPVRPYLQKQWQVKHKYLSSA